MRSESILSTSAAAAVSPGVGVGMALAALPVLPILLSGSIGYDDGSVRACILLGEVALVAVLGDGVRAAWLALPPALRWVAGVWLVAMVATTATALHVPAALMRTAEWAGHLALAASLWRWSAVDAGRARDVAQTVALGALALCVYATWAWCARVGWQDLASPNTPPTPAGGVRLVGFIAMASVTLGLSWWTVGTRASAVALASWVIGWTVLGWTGGRGSILATAAGVVAWIVVMRPGWRVVLLLSAGVVLGGALSLGLPDDNRTMGLARFVEDLAPGEGFTTNRGQLWAFLVDAWAARPWRGLGPDGAAFSLGKHTHAHNTVVQALVEWGVVGALAYGALLLAALAGLWRRVWRTARSPQRAVPAAAAAFWLAASLNGLLDGLFYGAGTLALLAVSLAVGFSAAGRADPRTAGRLSIGARRIALLSLAGIAGLYLLLNATRFMGGTPEPDSLRARLAMASGLSNRSTDLLWWGKDWVSEHPADALAVAQWGQAHSRLPWSFHDLEADLLLAAGDTTGAHRLFRRGVAVKRATLVGRREHAGTHPDGLDSATPDP